MKQFETSDLKNLWKPDNNSSGEDNGQVTIIGGSSLFHGAPLLALKTASRMVDMVFFASPQPSVGKIAEEIKSRLLSFIWVPWEEVEDYIGKSDACLIGPGMMRFNSEKAPHIIRQHACDEACQETKAITEKLLTTFSQKKWVVDAGSLQVIEPEVLPKGCIITPNKKEFELLFKITPEVEKVTLMAEKYRITIVLKGPETIVVSPSDRVVVKGGNPGMTKGGTGDILAGLTVAFLAKNEPFLAASAASFLEKAAADTLFKKVGTAFSADDLAEAIPATLAENLV